MSRKWKLPRLILETLITLELLGYKTAPLSALKNILSFEKKSYILRSLSFKQIASLQSKACHGQLFDPKT